MRTQRYEPKRLPANRNLAFVGAKQGTGTKTLFLTAKDILVPNYDLEIDDLVLETGDLDKEEAKTCKERLKRFTSFIAFPRYSKRLLTIVIGNQDRKVIPDDSIIYITSSRCLHVGYMCSTFFHVWFEYFQILRRDNFDFIEVFETFPFPEKMSSSSSPHTNYFDYLAYSLDHSISIEQAYDEIQSGLVSEDRKVSEHSFRSWELAELYGLPKKYRDNKGKILECLIAVSKDRELQKVG